MNVIDAAYKSVHDYPGGSESLGPRLGMSPAILRNKVNPNNDKHHLTLAEADHLMAVTGDHGILQALAAGHGYALVRADHGDVDGSLVHSVLAFLAASGKMSGSLQDVVAKGQVTRNASREIQALGADVQAALIRLMSQAISTGSKRESH